MFAFDGNGKYYIYEGSRFFCCCLLEWLHACIFNSCGCNNTEQRTNDWKLRREKSSAWGEERSRRWFLISAVSQKLMEWKSDDCPGSCHSERQSYKWFTSLYIKGSVKLYLGKSVHNKPVLDLAKQLSIPFFMKISMKPTEGPTT